MSAVTFAVATQFLTSLQVKPEGYMSAFLAVLEPTGVVMGILLARLALQIQSHENTKSRTDMIGSNPSFTKPSPAKAP